MLIQFAILFLPVWRVLYVSFMCRIDVLSLLMLSKCRRGYIIANVEISKVFFSVAGPYFYLLGPNHLGSIYRGFTLRSDLRSCRLCECLFSTVFEREDQGEVITSD